MKKICLILAAVLIIPAAAFAQDSEEVPPTFRGSGALDINVGLGLGTTLTGTGIPFNASLGYGINENISVGGYLGFAQTKEDINFGTGNGTWTYTNFIIGARGAYHYPLVENFDTYGGLMLGYNVASADWDGPGNPNASAGGVSYSAFVGGRYHFSNNLGAFAELGYGIAYLQFGLTIAM